MPDEKPKIQIYWGLESKTVNESLDLTIEKQFEKKGYVILCTIVLPNGRIYDIAWDGDSVWIK